jgi:hypothetical protein
MPSLYSLRFPQVPAITKGHNLTAGHNRSCSYYA